MGRDNLGPDLPPEELNLLRDNHNYGWPYCYGNRQPNPEYGDPALCADTTPPQFVFPAHWAPLGIDFYDQAAFPGYRNDALVAFHGSSPSQTNNTRQGARVVRVRFEQGRPVGYHDLLRGFEIGNRTWARPAGVLVAPDGSVLVSDDYGGRIFRIRYVGETP
jgi:glucose/arabinose dehydrogenase